MNSGKAAELKKAAGEPRRVTARRTQLDTVTLPRKDKDMADLVVFLTAIGMAIVAWLIQRALSGK